MRIGLQVDSLDFAAEPATKNTKPVQCYVCLQYNYVAKHCKTEHQVCARCDENHQLDQCCNCNGDHCATPIECNKYKEQEKRAQRLVNQHTAAQRSTAWLSAINSSIELPCFLNPLPQQQQKHITNGFFEKMIEEIINPPIITFQQIFENQNTCICTSASTTTAAPTAESRSNTKTVPTMAISNPSTTATSSSNRDKTTISTTAKKTSQEAKKPKRPRPLDSCLDASIGENEDPNSNKNDD